MKDCIDYRRSTLANPRDPDPALNEHRASCQECSAYAVQLMRFEALLERAVRVPLPTTKLDSVYPRRADSPPTAPGPRAYRRGWLAMAASVLLALVVAGGLWVIIPDRSLAAAVVTHMAGEPQAWRRTNVRVPDGALQDVLRASHLRLTPGATPVTYAASCSCRGYRVPHLVIQTESGPVTVMVLVHEHVSKSMQFDEQGYIGVIVPVAGHGSMAVLTRGPATDLPTVEQIARRVLDSIVWTG